MNTRVWVTNLILYKSNYTLYKEYKAVLMFATACYKNQFNYKGEFLGWVLFHNLKWIGNYGLAKPLLKLEL